VDDINIWNFGNLEGVSVVDFGCGDGSFLKKCIAKGATNCLGIDNSELLIKTALNAMKQEHDKVCFVIKDCFEPFDNTFGQFDFAACTFVLPHCENEEKLGNLFENMFRFLKPKGIAMVTHGLLPTTVKDQQLIKDLVKYSLPLLSEVEGDPPTGVSSPTEARDASGLPYLFRDYYWSVEKVKKNLEVVGFSKILSSRPTLSDFVPLEEAKQWDAMDDGPCLSFITAMKS